MSSIRHSIDLRSTARGLRYFSEGRVSQLHQEDDAARTWSALVKGSARKRYAAQLKLRGTQQDLTLSANHCSCPLGGDCKHIVAVLKAVEAALSETSEAQNDLVAEDGLATAELSAEAWSAQMHRALGSPDGNSEPLAPRSDTSFFYILKPGDGEKEHRHLRKLHLLICRQDKRFKQEGVIKLNLVSSQYLWDKLYADPLHRDVTHQLNVLFAPEHPWAPSSTFHYGSARRLPEDGAQNLLYALVDSGCVSFGNDATPLRRGLDLRAEIKWQPAEDNRLRLGLALPDEVRVIGTEAPLYLNTKEHSVGTLRTFAPANIMRMLSIAPAMTIDTARAFYNGASDELKAILPEPQEIVVEQRTVVPTPKLFVSESVEREGVPALLAEVSFCYDDAEARANDPTQELRYVRNGTESLAYPRNKGAEEAAIAQLAAESLAYDPAEATITCLVPTPQHFLNVLQGSFRRLAKAGWIVDNIPQLQQGEVLHADGPLQAQVKEHETQNSWFDCSLQIDAEGRRIDLAKLLAQVLGSSYLPSQDVSDLPDTLLLPLDDGKLVAVPKSRIAGALDILFGIGNIEGNGLPQATALATLLDTEDVVITGKSKLLDSMRRLRNFDGLKLLKMPKRLQATLRPYQQLGVTWLEFLRSNNFGGILADDMGLGKTLQIIAYVLYLKEHRKLSRPVMVVAPAGLLSNWSSEIRKFAPSLHQTTFYGGQRDKSTLSAGDIILTSYGVLVRDAETLSSLSFSAVVFDESQTVKNARSATHHAARGLQADHFICLSGTPLQNNLEELWAQFAICMPGLLGNHRTFTKFFDRPIRRGGDATAQRALHSRTRPFILRRRKADVAHELPAKTETIERVTFGRKQADLYESVRSAMNERVHQAIAEKGIESAHITILSALLKMRQVCCDPRLLKVARKTEKLESAKLIRLVELACELVAEGRTLLIFSQFTEMLDLISDTLKKKKLSHLVYTGKTRGRNEVVDQFQRNEVPIMLVSLKAGGVGLNLTAADTVIHYDPWWNPAVELQATDRAYRIGQDRPVHVYKLIVAGTLEEKILELQASKQRLADQVLDDGATAWNLTADDLMKIFDPVSHES